MSERFPSRPLPLNNSPPITRRRHHHVDIFDREPEAALANASETIVSFPNRRLNNPTPSKPRTSQEGLKPHVQVQPPLLPCKENSGRVREGNSSSFSNLSALITPASQFWNSAQNSIQSFADTYSQSLLLPQQQTTEDQQSSADASSADELSMDNHHSEPTTEMPFRDRTNEFRTIAKSCQLKFQANGHVRNSEDRDRMFRSSIQFNQLARRIGRDLSLTCAKMERLTELAKKRSLFDDRAEEVQELTFTIKQDITGLNRQIAGLQDHGNQTWSPTTRRRPIHLEPRA